MVKNKVSTKKTWSKYARKGYILPLVMLISVLVLSPLAIWYQQRIVNGYLAEQLINQRAQSIEIRSLIPLVTKQLDSLDKHALLSEQNDFFILEYNQKKRWQIGRSKHKFGKIQLTFHSLDTANSPVQITIPYER